MLCALTLRDFVIVDALDISFEAGFTVFSGETGAGKSILIDALSLTLGTRGDAGMIRPGAQRADITASFDVPESLKAWLDEHAIDTQDGLMLRRIIDREGRSRAFINGLPATVTQLRTLGEQLVDIHGQHAHQSLLHARQQRELLDTHGGHGDVLEKLQRAWQDWQAAQKALALARQHAGERQARMDHLQWQLDELAALAPGAEEWSELTATHHRLAHARALLDGGSQALEALDDDERGARRLLLQARHSLEPLLQHDARLADMLDSLDSALIASDTAISDLNAYLSRLELDPDALEQAEARMSAIFGLARRLNNPPEALPALQQALQAEMQDLQETSSLDALSGALEAAHLEYQRHADTLSRQRRKTAQRLGEQVTRAMQTLAMEGGAFDVALTSCAPGPHGCETVSFQVAGHAGASLRPLAKVASGGELARISLALSVIASQAARVPTLIFDEVDAGIGGGVAEVVGRLLRDLGKRHQVLCVTHLPQVAARGRQHFEVRKATEGGETISHITALDSDGRVEEIARMLGGLTITDTTRRHAMEMLAD